MKKIIITGMPRSGTSWLGQIFNSHPRVMFRMEPLFAYRFKNKIDRSSTCADIVKFVSDLEDVDDEFILQKENQASGHYPVFDKQPGETLVFKTTRHHELLERYLECLEDLHIVAIVRHPCGAINSWISSEREFSAKGCSIDRDWRSGECRKKDTGEYWGFQDWLDITRGFQRLAREHGNFHLVRYADLVLDTEIETRKLFANVGLDLGDQTMRFLRDCHDRHDPQPYAVFKDRKVLDAWRGNLRADVADAITIETEAAGLGEYLI